MLIFDQADVLSAGSLTRVMALNAQGFGLALRNPDRAALARDDGLLSLMTHVEAEFGNPDLAQMVRLAGQAEHLLGVVVNNAADWQEFEVCAELGVMSFFGNLCTAPHRTALAASVSETEPALVHHRTVDADGSGQCRCPRNGKVAQARCDAFIPAHPCSFNF